MFGCFDECFNYLAGYFILKGKILYKEYFFNHQMLMAYLSSIIQLISHPQSIYHLVLYHRIFIFLFALLMDILIIFRFGKSGVGFVLLFETTKFYYMGSLFLPESIIVYLLVYLLGICWYKFTKRTIFSLDYILCGIFAWAVIFMREPFVPVAFFIYLIILLGKTHKRAKHISLGIFIILSLSILFITDLKNYFYQIAVVNLNPLASGVKSGGFFGLEILKMFLYPIYIFLYGKWTFLRQIQIGISSIFIIASIILVFRFRILKPILCIIIILGLSSIRLVSPGTAFYEAFHMLPWYGLFVMSSFLFVQELYMRKVSKYILALLTVLCVFVIGYAMSPKSFFIENVYAKNIDRNKEFKLGFDKYIVNGETIRLLSGDGDTLFIDRWDDLIYWQAKLNSPYKYTVYVGPAHNDPVFEVARLEMFRNNPPDFYYYSCSGKQFASPYLPDFRVKDYVQLYYIDKPSCLYVKKAKLTKINSEKWDKIRILRFYLPEKS